MMHLTGTRRRGDFPIDTRARDARHYSYYNIYSARARSFWVILMGFAGRYFIPFFCFPAGGQQGVAFIIIAFAASIARFITITLGAPRACSAFDIRQRALFLFMSRRHAD